MARLHPTISGILAAEKSIFLASSSAFFRWSVVNDGPPTGSAPPWQARAASSPPGRPDGSGRPRTAKKARIEHLYAIADREVVPDRGEPEVIFCVDEFGPLNLQPRSGRQWAAVSGKNAEADRAPRPRMRATYRRTEGVRHLFAAYDLGEDKLYGHVKPRKNQTRFLEFCRYLRTLYPLRVRIAIVCDNYSPHLTAAKDGREGAWAAANNVEIAYTPTNSS